MEQPQINGHVQWLSKITRGYYYGTPPFSEWETSHLFNWATFNIINSYSMSLPEDISHMITTQSYYHHIITINH